MASNRGRNPLGDKVPRMKIQRSTDKEMRRRGLPTRAGGRLKNPSIGDMPRGLNPKKPITNNEKKMMAKLDRLGRNRSKERYDNWERRVGDANKPMGASQTRKKEIGTKSIGGVGLGFSVHFDKKGLTDGMEGEIATVARLSQAITQRFAINEGMRHATTFLDIAEHLGGKDRMKKVKGDVFDVLKGSLHTMEMFDSATGQSKGRFMRHVAGSYGDGEWPSQADNPTGVKGGHEGKTVNLSEMYEDGVEPFAFSDKLVTLFASSGARRSRGDTYIATLKGNHPGFPAVKFMARWLSTTSRELDQTTYDATAQVLVSDMIKKIGTGVY